MRIMVFDEDRNCLESICRLLEEADAGFSWVVPTSIGHAISTLRSRHIDCLLIGPGVSNQLLAIARCRRLGHALPIVALIPTTQGEQAEHMVRAGAEECVCIQGVDGATLALRIKCAITRVLLKELPLQHEQVFRAAFDKLRVQLCLVNKMGVIVESIDWNASTSAYGIGEVGTNIFDSLRILAKHGHESAQSVGTALRDILAGRIQTFDAAMAAFDHPRRSVEVQIFAIRTGESSTAAILQRDTTDQRLLQHELESAAATSEVLALVAKHIDDAVLITDRDVKIEWVNDAFERLYGYTLGEIRGKSPQELLHGPRTDQEVVEAIQQAIESKRGFDFEIKHYTKAGATIWAEVEMRPIADSEGKLKRRIAVIRNITARKQAEQDRDALRQQLLESSRRAGMADTATCVLHNVGNVLNSVNVTARTLESRIRDSSSDRLLRFADKLLAYCRSGQKLDEDETLLPEYMASITKSIQDDRDIILHEVTDLQEQIDHLREIVVLQQSLATAKSLARECDIIELVEDAIRINGAGLSRHQVTLVRDYRVRPVLICQMHKVLQILVNLISNAKYALSESDRQPAIMTVRVEMRDDRARIEISDNGVGIAKENLTRVFELGFTTREEGHGFGLHSSANAAKEIGGTISAKSDGVGNGATFCLEFAEQRNEDEVCSPTATPHDKC